MSFKNELRAMGFMAFLEKQEKQIAALEAWQREHSPPPTAGQSPPVVGGVITTGGDRSKLVDEFTRVINRNSAENGSNTPDWILAEYLVNCLEAFDRATHRRERWYGHHHAPGMEETPALKEEEEGE